MPTNEDESSTREFKPGFMEAYNAMKAEGYVCSQTYRWLLEEHGIYFMSPKNDAETGGEKKLVDDATET